MNKPMERRQLLKALAAVPLLPLVVHSETVGAAAKIDPGSRYVIFVNSDMIDVHYLVESLSGQFPDGTPVYAVLVQAGGSLDDDIRIYELRAG